MEESTKGYNLRRGRAAQKSEEESSSDEGVAELLSSTGRPKRSAAANSFSFAEQPASKRRKVNIPENAATSSSRAVGFGEAFTGRFCASCGTTATSQWRRGPHGMLCNSCGLKAANQSRSRRQNKATADDDRNGADVHDTTESEPTVGSKEPGSSPTDALSIAEPDGWATAPVCHASFEPVYITDADKKELLQILREVRPADGESAELRRENMRLQKELLEMTEKRLADQRELTRLMDALEEARSRRDEITENFRDMVDKCFKLEDTNFQVSKQLERTEDELESFKEALADTSEADLQRQLKNREKENEELKARLAVCETEIASLRQNSSRLMESVTAEMRLREQLQLQQQQQQVLQAQQVASSQQAQQQLQAQVQAQAQAQAQQAQQQTQQQQQQQYLAQLQAAQLQQYAAMYGGIPRGYPTPIPMSQADLMKMAMHPAMMQQYAAAAAAAAAGHPVPGQTS